MSFRKFKELELNNSIQEQIYEALTLKQARPYIKAWKESGMEKYLKHLFPTKDRLYFPLLTDGKLIQLKDSKHSARIEKTLKDLGYSIEDYHMGVCTKDDDPKKKNIFKIGKILNKYEKFEELKIFNEDESRDKVRQLGRTDLLVVISRHPYDIAGMSTDRGWTSCMNLETGSYAKHVIADILEGTLIAYVIENTDLNIQRPKARILIKPFFKVNDPKEIILVPEEKIYPANIPPPPGFAETVKNWLDSWQKIKSGNYSLNCKLYTDSIDKLTILKPRSELQTKEEVIENLMIALDFKDSSEKFIQRYGIKVNDDLSVDVKANIRFDKKMKEFPVQFGIIDGYFSCSRNLLTSLSGAPRIVKGDFFCDSNQLVSLEGAPKEVGGDFYCSFNQLVSLVGAPEEVGGGFDCSTNKLTSFVGTPKKVGDIDWKNNPITSFVGFPESIKKLSIKYMSEELQNLEGLSNVKELELAGFTLKSLVGLSPKMISLRINTIYGLKDLIGAPNEINTLEVSNCPDLLSLKGMPIKAKLMMKFKELSINSFDGFNSKVVCPLLDFSNNRINSFEGLPETVNGSLILTNNNLKNLEGSPKIIKGNLLLQENDLTSIEGNLEQVEGVLNLENQNTNAKFNAKDVSSKIIVKKNIFV